MHLFKPLATPYDPLEWERLPFAEKARHACLAWALQGYGSPLGIYVFYLFKIGLYVGGWIFCCSFHGSVSGDFWFEPLSFQKAIVWSMLFEVLGLGCGSGPLTGRYLPPFGGALYFLRPGTTKLPPWPSLPLFGGHRRSLVDVLAYAALCGWLIKLCVASTLPSRDFLVLVGLLAVAALGDKTIFLAARSEHYATLALCFGLSAGTDWLPAAKCVQLALWFWAGVSKLNAHFPAVVCVMTSNGPFTPFAWLRKRMYRSFPDDLRPSRLPWVMAHVGTGLELGVPIVLAIGDGGMVTTVGMVMMLLLHGYITSNVPMGVPIEWNVVVVYSALFLFGTHAEVRFWALDSPLLAVILIGALVVVPLVGNFFPRWVSFLMSMRYYAGNWAYSVWLFRGESSAKLDERLTKSAARAEVQLSRFYDRSTLVGVLGKVMAFRMMHLHGRALSELVPRAIEGDFNDYEWMDGEIVAGLVLGYNFGDGHLHDERLLAAVQAQCDFAAGELRCIFVESQPLLGKTLAWRICDAADGQLASGEVAVADLLARSPSQTASASDG